MWTAVVWLMIGVADNMLRHGNEPLGAIQTGISWIRRHLDLQLHRMS